ncbi:C-C motif chemokine 27a [Dicentrarchus labrax]|uniref:C-C motif chemokine n=1 Tax=Dicentrarchus labrax TaxID=13489 RepID=A0A8P4G1I3_DICLA|nr:C-C motif chemokine 27a [Dicentrarchus labrax]
MDLKVAFVIVCLCAFAITSTEAGIAKCCITTQKIPKRLLLKVQRWKEQTSDGACDIRALVLHLKGRDRPMCVDLSYKKYLERLMRKQHSKRGAYRA